MLACRRRPFPSLLGIPHPHGSESRPAPPGGSGESSGVVPRLPLFARARGGSHACRRAPPQSICTSLEARNNLLDDLCPCLVREVAQAFGRVVQEAIHQARRQLVDDRPIFFRKIREPGRGLIDLATSYRFGGFYNVRD